VHRQVGGCSRTATVTDAVVARLASASGITSLDLSGCLEVSDAGATAVTGSKYPIVQ
jgi:hypothetical protein